MGIPGELCTRPSVVSLKITNFSVTDKFFFVNTTLRPSVADLTDDLFQNINKNEVTLAVFIDLRKAFDTINHDLLL